MYRKLSDRARDESGQATAWFVGIAILLFAIIAFGFDMGLLFNSRRVAQNSVDAGVLAGAAHLQGCALAATGNDPETVGIDYAERNLYGALGATETTPQMAEKPQSFTFTNAVGTITLDTVAGRVERDQGYLFANFLGIGGANVPATAEATCGPISEGSVCPMWIEGDPSQPVVDENGDGIPETAYGLNLGEVYGMKINSDSEHYGALESPTGDGKNEWRDFIANGCEEDGVTLEVCEGCEVDNEPGDFGNPVHQALEGGGPVSNGLYTFEKTSNLFTNGHLDCDLALTLDPDDSTTVMEVRGYDAVGFPTGSALNPDEVVQLVNSMTDPDDMSAGAAPCGALTSNGDIVTELTTESVQGRFMHIVLANGECTSSCSLPVLGILRMYIVCWTNQEAPGGGDIPEPQRCAPNEPPSQTTIYGVFADFSAPSLLGGGGLGTNPLSPRHVVLIK